MVEYDHDFEETVTGLWDLKKLQALDDSLGREVANQKEEREPILLPPKKENKQEKANNESSRIHTK